MSHTTLIYTLVCQLRHQLSGGLFDFCVVGGIGEAEGGEGCEEKVFQVLSLMTTGFCLSFLF